MGSLHPQGARESELKLNIHNRCIKICVNHSRDAGCLSSDIGLTLNIFIGNENKVKYFNFNDYLKSQ